MACIYGVLRNYYSLKARLDPMLQKPLRRKDRDIECLLLSGLHQLESMHVPPHAVVSAEVEAARGLGKTWACGLVNAVLRRVLRKANDDGDLTTSDESIIYQHPSWLIDRLKKDWPDHWQSILQANNQHPPLSLRINTAKTSIDAYMATLSEHRIKASAGAWAQAAINLEQALAVEQIPGFADGQVSVQDQAAQLAASLLEVKPGDRVLDACAAPGGKTGHLLELMAGDGYLLALDHDDGRLREVGENLQRLGLHGETLSADARAPQVWWDDEPFQRILLDAPCSALGVVRRHPDIRFHRQASDFDALSQLQLELLQALWPLLAVGGRLLYATCSIVPAENDRVIEAMLNAHTNVEVKLFNAEWGQPMNYGRQILPGDDGMDGFYYALLEKTGRSE